MHRPISINIRHRFSLNCFWVFLFCFVHLFPLHKSCEKMVLEATPNTLEIAEWTIGWRIQMHQGEISTSMSPGKRTRKTRGSNICWPALVDAVHTIEMKQRPVCTRRTPKCEYLCGGSFMSISFSFIFFFLSYSRREMRESTQKKKPNITHDYIHEFYYYFEELYLCYYFIKWADAVGHYHFLEHSNNPCHLSLSLCVCNSHLRTCRGDRATVR